MRSRKIPKLCKDLEELMDEYSQPYATKFSEAERDYEEKDAEETYRTNYRRDRDRILYTIGFRTLQYKTQVFVNNAGDYYRTRLTHTLEVQQLATSIADALGANRDLAEAIAVGHDVGHSPFGHVVEKLINEKLTTLEKGVFSHAIQSVRYIEHLESRKGQEGLNLTKQVREGILKHDSDVLVNNFDENCVKQWDCTKFNPNVPGSLEMQIVYWADKIAYLSHDWDDFVDSGLKNEAENEGIIKKGELDEVIQSLVIDKKGNNLRDLIRNINKNLIDGTIQNIEECEPKSSNDIRKITEQMLSKNISRNNNIYSKRVLQDSLFVNFTDDYRCAFLKAKELLFKTFVYSPMVTVMSDKAKYMVSNMFDKYMEREENNRLLPWKVQNEISKGKEEKARIVADYIVSMTDRCASRMYEEMFLPWR